MPTIYLYESDDRPGVMPPEPYASRAEVKARETGIVLASQGSGANKNFRFKMQKIAERCLVPTVGRALGQELHLRVDEFGNPEILYARGLLVRLTLEGLRLAQNVNIYGLDRNAHALLKQVIYQYTSYKENSGGYVPSNIDVLVKNEGLATHTAYSSIGDDCSVCVQHREYFDKVNVEIAEQRKKYEAFVESKTISFGKRGEPKRFPLIPYKEDWQSIGWLPDLVAKQWDKISKSRDWNRRDMV